MDQGPVFCFGDSNTYGYDPRSPLGERYAPAHRWCDLLEQSLGLPVVNAGENGLSIPASDRQRSWLLADLRRIAPSLLVILLGTNDLLRGLAPEEIARRMEQLLAAIRSAFPHLPLLLLPPPPLHLPGSDLDAARAHVVRCYQNLAREYGLGFCPLDGLDLGWDGVHLSEMGHHQLANLLSRTIPILQTGNFGVN